MHKLLLGLVIATQLAGCTWGNWHSIYRKYDLTDGSPNSLSIGVKQRVVLAKAFSDPKIIACAEPSPDALSAVTAAIAGRADAQGYGGGDVSLATAESVLNIGLRTQTIQILRDAMYRLCEAYFNGAINQREMISLQKRYQNSMVALLAIEQLTGATTPRQSYVFAGGTADTGKHLLEAQSALEQGEAAQKVADADVVSDDRAWNETWPQEDGRRRLCVLVEGLV